jgi:hypothetical protein
VIAAASVYACIYVDAVDLTSQLRFVIRPGTLRVRLSSRQATE